MPSAPAIVPTPAPPNLVTYTVKINGEKLPETMQLVHVSVSICANKIPYAKLNFLDGNAAEQSFENSDDSRFATGSEVEIELGYQSHETSVFKGLILKHGIKISTGKPPLMYLDCRHKAIAATLDRRYKQFSESTDSDIISELLAGVAGDIDSTDLAHQVMLQHYATDWDFAKARAAANGLLILPQLDTVNVLQPNFSKSPALALSYGNTIEEFEAETDARDQLAAMTVGSWNPADQEAISADSSASPAEPDHGSNSSDELASSLVREDSEYKTNSHLKEEELQALADAAMTRSRVAKIRGRVRCQGFADILPGDIVTLEGVGKRFSGNAYVAAVNHEVAQGNWRTHLQFGIDPDWFKIETQTDSAHFVNKTHGLHIGIVAQLEEDPDGEERILVKLPTTHADAEGVWARLSTIDAGAERGFVWRPEIDDEVILAFLDNDPRSPVILGALHSSASPTHLPASDDNHLKGYQSREGLQLLFDDENKNLTIQTESGNKLFLSEEEGGIIVEDENGNLITLSSDGIALESVADLNLTASGDVNIQGTNVSIKADAEATVEGSAGAKLESSAQTTVKGSIVMIN